MLIVLTVEGETVVDAKFSTYPCPAAHACGEFVTQWTVGKNRASASAMNDELIVRSIGQMPLGREHCPRLACDSLMRALDQFEVGHPAGEDRR